MKARTTETRTATADSVKAPGRSSPPRLAARLVARYTRSCGACFVGAATSDRPLSFPPVPADSTVYAGGNGRGDVLGEGGRRKHWSEGCEARSASNASGSAASTSEARSEHERSAQRDPRAEHVGAFTLFAVAVVAVRFDTFRLAVTTSRPGEKPQSSTRIMFCGTVAEQPEPSRWIPPPRTRSQRRGR